MFCTNIVMLHIKSHVMKIRIQWCKNFATEACFNSLLLCGLFYEAICFTSMFYLVLFCSCFFFSPFSISITSHGEERES